MKSIIFLNKSYFNHCKSKILKQIFVFILCSSLLVVQSLSVYNLYMDVNDKLNISNGIYDAVIINPNEDTNGSVLPIVEEGNIKLIATAENKEALYNSTLNIGYIDSKATELLCLKYSAGRMPQKANEIVLEKRAFSVLRHTFQVGDTLTLEMTSIDGETFKTYEFKICGIIENYSSTQWKIKDSDSMFPQVLVSEEFSETSLLPTVQMNLVNFSEQTTKKQIESLISKNNICENYFFNELSTVDLELNQFISVGSLVLVIFSGFIAIFLLINNLMLKRQETHKRIGLYKIVGMKRAEILLTFLLRDFPSLLIGCFLGSLCGYILLINFYPRIMKSEFLCRWDVIVLTNICLIAFYSLLVIIEIIRLSKKTITENVKQSDNAQKIHNVKCNTKNPLLLWAWKNYILNSATSTSLCFLILIAILIGGIGTTAMDYVNVQLEMSSPADIEIIAYNGATTESIGIPEDVNFGIREEDLSFLCESSNINNCISLKNLIVNAEVPPEKANSAESGLWHSDKYKQSLQKFGYETDIGLHQDYLIGADENTIKKLESQKNIQGNIDYDKLNTAKEVILCNAGGTYDEYKVGDEITLTQIIDNKKHEFNVTVGAIINFESGNYFESMEAMAFGDRMIWGVKSFEALGIELNFNHILLSLNDIDDYEDMDMRLNALNSIYNQTESNNQFRISENFQQAQLYRTIQKILTVGYNFIIIVILLFVFTSSAISTNIRLEQQRKVFAAMRAIGLREVDLFLIILIEKLCQLIFSFVIGTVLSGVFIFLFNREIGVNLAQFPVALYLALMLVLSIVLSVISYISAHSFFKKPIAEHLRHN
jgi:ABC-type antimicrobial peptide transport system permease subunit